LNTLKLNRRAFILTQKMETDTLKFISFLNSKGLSSRYAKEMLYYHSKFQEVQAGNPKEDAIKLLSRFHNSSARAFLLNYFEFKDIEIKVPKLTGRKKERVITPLSQEEYQTLYIAMYNKSLKYGLMFSLQSEGALRVKEMLNIQANDIRLRDWLNDNDKHCRISIIGKGNKERIIIISPKTTIKLLGYLKNVLSNNPLETKLFKISYSRYERVLKNTALRSIGRKINSHLLRHSKANFLNEQNVNILDIKNYLGHSSISTTQRYIHRESEKSLQEIEKAME